MKMYFNFFNKKIYNPKWKKRLSPTAKHWFKTHASVKVYEVSDIQKLWDTEGMKKVKKIILDLLCPIDKKKKQYQYQECWNWAGKYVNMRNGNPTKTKILSIAWEVWKRDFGWAKKISSSSWQKIILDLLRPIDKKPNINIRNVGIEPEIFDSF